MIRLKASVVAALSVSLVACFVAGAASAQTTPRAPTSFALGDASLTPVLELRLRAEARHDPPDMGGHDRATGLGSRVRAAVAGLERARLGAQVDVAAVRARVVVEDARLWGTAASEGSLGPYETWLEVHSSGAKPALLRVGRQPVVWGEGLLLGAADFGVRGRALDAVRGILPVGPLELEALASLLAAPRPSTPTFGPSGGVWSSGAQLYGLRVAWPLAPLLALELGGLTRVSRTGEVGSPFETARGLGETTTVSLRAKGTESGFAYGAEGAFQFGQADRIGGSRRAWAAFAHVSKAFDALRLAPAFRLGASYASGDDGSGATYGQFDPLLPDVHVHFGAMNAFAWSNTMQAHARAKVEPFAEAELLLEYRYARLAEANGEWLSGNLTSIGRDPLAASAELGHEVDVLFNYAPWPAFDVGAGYALALWGDGARAILQGAGRGRFDAFAGAYVPSDTSHYGFLQARLRLP